MLFYFYRRHAGLVLWLLLLAFSCKRTRCHLDLWHSHRKWSVRNMFSFCIILELHACHAVVCADFIGKIKMIWPWSLNYMPIHWITDDQIIQRFVPIEEDLYRRKYYKKKNEVHLVLKLNAIPFYLGCWNKCDQANAIFPKTTAKKIVTTCSAKPMRNSIFIIEINYHSFDISFLSIPSLCECVCVCGFFLSLLLWFPFQSDYYYLIPVFTFA